MEVPLAGYEIPDFKYSVPSSPEMQWNAQHCSIETAAYSWKSHTGLPSDPCRIHGESQRKLGCLRTCVRQGPPHPPRGGDHMYKCRYIPTRTKPRMQVGVEGTGVTDWSGRSALESLSREAGWWVRSRMNCSPCSSLISGVRKSLLCGLAGSSMG